MKVRRCPKCGKMNLLDDWSCKVCGETLSVNTVVDIDDSFDWSEEKKQDDEFQISDRECSFCGGPITNIEEICTWCGSNQEGFSTQSGVESAKYSQLFSDLLNGNDQQRRVASYKLSKFYDPIVVPYLVFAYSDPDSSVRRNVTEGLNIINAEEAITFLRLSGVAKKKVVQRLRQDKPTIELLKQILHDVAQESSSSQNSGKYGIEISQEAQRHFEKAMFMWGDKGASELNEQERRDISAMFALAIKKASIPFPTAESNLALLLYFSGDSQNALQHANLALHYDENAFRAQLVRIFNSIDNLQDRKLGLGDFIGEGGNLENFFASTVAKSAFSLTEKAMANSTKGNLKKEILKLVSIYQRICKLTIDVDEFIDNSEMMILLGDIIDQIPMSGWRPNLYLEVMKAPISNLDLRDRAEEVEDILTMAEGKSELFRP